MINNDDNFLTIKNNQFVLSYELLYLLRWITRHNENEIQALVAKAIDSGLKEELKKLDTVTTAQQDVDVESEDIQQTLAEFFDLLEAHLADKINEETIKKARASKLIPTIEQIDTSVCDDATVRSSVETVTRSLDNGTKNNPKEQFFKELLKQWKPYDKNIYN